jgi:very-short-patch-repair endonuclease
MMIKKRAEVAQREVTPGDLSLEKTSKRSRINSFDAKMQQDMGGYIKQNAMSQRRLCRRVNYIRETQKKSR